MRQNVRASIAQTLQELRGQFHASPLGGFLDSLNPAVNLLSKTAKATLLLTYVRSL